MLTSQQIQRDDDRRKVGVRTNAPPPLRRSVSPKIAPLSDTCRPGQVPPRTSALPLKGLRWHSWNFSLLVLHQTEKGRVCPRGGGVSLGEHLFGGLCPTFVKSGIRVCRFSVGLPAVEGGRQRVDSAGPHDSQGEVQQHWGDVVPGVQWTPVDRRVG